MTSLLDVPHSPSEAALEAGLDGSSLESRIPFAFSRARLGQVLRRLGVGNAVHRSCRGWAAVSTATEVQRRPPALITRRRGGVTERPLYTSALSGKKGECNHAPV
jgi:hypothetical protein